MCLLYAFLSHYYAKELFLAEIKYEKLYCKNLKLLRKFLSVKKDVNMSHFLMLCSEPLV